ncbi:hypothetical protein ASPZODRAFT_17481 [Penicilliopsis zonata CBS 506.65]|uniref:Rhodopsin domain-containing protein n=1 Tax=Penicilliopsis zonata CBS 506.65 TaxID=1073090 RepID=A0A1L9SDK5_9EURO|nr:hypothetical protein ASPZODRAFT_17481 [Penicilliopsis zonata CBS 506.65]OJJ45261.1 hypothetical protein ASPZODRAFT_17481 [Penicilliopsis zonata CBS 506.65]
MSAQTSTTTGYDHSNLHHVVITATCFAFLLSTVSVVLRIVSRKINGTGLFIDDYFIIGALFFLYGITIAGIVLMYNGLGTHLVYVSSEHLVVYMKTLFTGSILYTCCIACIKLSILTLYRRLFPTKSMLVAVNIVGAIVVLWCFGACLISTVTCIPLHKLWEPTVPGGCIDLPKFYYGLQGPNIITDAVILIMPMKIVWDLPISRVQKSLLSGIFVVGFLTLIFDIIRLIALIQLANSGDDATYNEVPSSVWTCIEPAVGITAACLSNMRPLFTIVYRRLGGDRTAGPSEEKMKRRQSGSPTANSEAASDETQV